MRYNNQHGPVKIAGGGISGLTAAIKLAQAGRTVDVFEKRGASGARFKGDLQGLENWTSEVDVLAEMKAQGLTTDFYSKALPTLQVINGFGMNLQMPLAKPLCYLVKRGTDHDTLDQALTRQAAQLGVNLHYQHPLAPDQADIIATGPSSRQIFAVDAGIKFKTSHPDTAIALVNDAAACRGYGYLLIVDGYGCLCTVLFDRFPGLAEAYRKTEKIILNHCPLDMTEVKKVGGIGGFSHGFSFASGSRLKVGEAAGIQDLLFGFGIRSAMQSAYLAARSIIQDTEYSQQAQAAFGQKRKAGIVCRYIYEKAAVFESGYGFLSRLVQGRPDPVRFMRRAYHFTPIHKLLFPLAKSGMQKRYPNLLS